jgi:hypothetical protein
MNSVIQLVVVDEFQVVVDEFQACTTSQFGHRTLK